MRTAVDVGPFRLEVCAFPSHLLRNLAMQLGHASHGETALNICCLGE